MSLIFATQLTTIATAVLAAFAVITAVFALLAFRKQSREVDILLKQNQREADESRRAQAAYVFTAVPQSPGPEVRVYARNASHAPVYDAQFFYARDGDRLRTGPRRPRRDHARRGSPRQPRHLRRRQSWHLP
jgi:hypothetical protein